ncbi:MAG TPA: DUF411 domain-containing protein [Longimicrobiales bacterium]|nr:DUF411 domain-containing protein [Longimicrobiales bacterium]
MMKKLLPLLGIMALAMAGTALFLRGGDEPSGDTYAAATGEAEVVVYKSPTCGCCTNWVDHMRESGFTVRTVDLTPSALAQRKAEAGVPGDLDSCHTAVVDGYAVEGHVPANVVARLLEDRPAVAGISVPGMPIGSPGMEGPNPEAYDVIAFDRNGERVVYESVFPGQTSDAR